MKDIHKIKGFYDLIAEQAARYSFLEQTALDVFQRYGFREIRIPLIEKTALFLRTLGEETDIVQKEMYTFPDRKARSLTLRPEATAGVVRAYIENNLYTKEQVSKLFTYGPMFRYERPQKGRSRQFHQINVEMFGPKAPQADAELILMLHRYLQEIGLERISLELNSLGCEQCRPGFEQVLLTYLSGVDQQALCQDCQRRIATNPLRIFDCKQQQCQSYLKQAPLLMDSLCSDCKEHFAAVLSILDRAEVPYTLNPRLVRGLDYYQRTTFEVISNDIGSQSAIAGGGRYDGLVRELGGPDVPGLGFACGLERLVMLLDKTSEAVCDFYVAALEDEATNQAQIVAERLRHKGFSGQVSFEAKSPKSSLRQANKLGAQYCLLLGAQELADQTIVCKEMTTGRQKTFSQKTIETAFEEVQQGKEW